MVFLGGSVTAGHDLPTNPEAKSWAQHVHEWLQTLAPDPTKVRSAARWGVTPGVACSAGQPASVSTLCDRALSHAHATGLLT